MRLSKGSGLGRTCASSLQLHSQHAVAHSQHKAKTFRRCCNDIDAKALRKLQRTRMCGALMPLWLCAADLCTMLPSCQRQTFDACMSQTGQIAGAAAVVHHASLHCKQCAHGCGALHLLLVCDTAMRNSTTDQSGSVFKRCACCAGTARQCQSRREAGMAGHAHSAPALHSGRRSTCRCSGEASPPLPSPPSCAAWRWCKECHRRHHCCCCYGCCRRRCCRGLRQHH